MAIDHNQSAEHQYQRDLSAQEAAGETAEALTADYSANLALMTVHMAELGLNSRALLVLIAYRLLEGQRLYGDWNKGGDMRFEMLCEAADGLVYGARMGLQMAKQLDARDATIERLMQAAAAARPTPAVYSTGIETP